ncbi:MAG: Spy/CpxP family protein refolding chaperone [Candidatus Obscuribacterales bacterium]
MFGKGGFGPAAIFGGQGLGHMGHHGPMGGSKCGPGGLLSELHLSEEQLLNVAALKGKTLSKIAHAKLELMELKKEAFKELLQPKVDRAKFSSLTEKIKAQKSQCVDLMSENLIAFSEVLTPEQKAKLRLSIVKKFLGVDDILEDEDL